MPSVDPTFPVRLRELRLAQGLGVRALARRVPCSATHIVDMEAGRKRPSLATLERLDAALGADGALVALMVEEPDRERRERIRRAIENPSRLDAPTVIAFADVLAATRRLNDVLLAELMLPWVRQQWDTVQQVARDARGTHAKEFAAVAAEWTQFLGWLCVESRLDVQADQLLNQAIQQSEAAEDPTLTSQAIRFLGWLDQQRGNRRGMLRHFRAAYHTSGSHPLQRACNAARVSAGLAQMGEQTEARALLRDVEAMIRTAPTDPPRTAYWLSPDFVRLDMGLALLDLGEPAAAAEHLGTGLDALPPEWFEARWAHDYRMALERAGS